MPHKLRGKSPADEPVMSDLTILVSVEDLINIAMGPAEGNTVNYKMIQTVLHILARQMRLLETKVDIKIADSAHLRKKKKMEPHSSESPSSDKHVEESEKEKSLKGAKKKDKSSKDKEKDKDAKEKEDSDSDKKEEMTEAKEREKMDVEEREKFDKMSPKEREKVMQEKEKQKKYKEQTSDYQDDSDIKETTEQRRKSIKEKEQKVLEKMTPEEKATYIKQKEKEEQIMKNMSPKEKEKYLKEKEVELNKLQEMTPKEKEKHFKEKEKELNTLEQMSSAEKEKYFKEKEKQKSTKEKETDKEKEKEEQKSKKDKETFQDKDKGEQKSKKDKETYQDEEKEEKKSKQDKETYQGKEKEEQKSKKDKETYQDKEKEEQKSKKDKETYQDKEKEGKKSQKEKEATVLEKMSPKEKELYLKQKEREEKALQKISPKEKEKYFEEKEKEDRALERMPPKEREKYLQEKEEEAILLEKMTPTEQEKYLNKKKKQTKAIATGSGTSIAITEVERQKEKILIVEKGPTTRAASKTRVGSIEVVTVSQFNLLKGEVERLKQTAAPLPMPALPDNKKLKADLVKGNASLTDTMQAMQVSARVQAAEAGLARMAGLLTQLAASGALPESFAGQLENAKSEMEALRSDLKDETRPAPKGPSLAAQARKSVAIDPLTMKQSQLSDESVTGAGTGTGTSTGTRPSSVGTSTRPSSGGAEKRASVGAVMALRHSRASVAGRSIAVTRNEMDDAIQSLRDDMTKSMQAMTYRAASSAETAAGTAKGISDKMEIALNLNARISDLYALTSDYAEQLSGFDAGLTTQMRSFQEQMVQMREDLRAGLVHLDMTNNNAETAAVLELTERFNGLQNDLEVSLVEHQRLTAFQKQLGEELRGLVEAVETLKEQKADRDEVWDGLRDKADLAKLSGLLTEEDFALSRAELDERLEVCYKKFNRQEKVWMTAMKDLNEIAEDKAEIMQLLSVKEDAQDQLQDVQEKLRVLALQLGEPKAAILTRLLSKDGKCGACVVPALMEGVERLAGIPHQLPALRPPPDGQPCVPDFTPIVMEDENTKSHICKRWVGGSHTLLSRTEPREVAPGQLAPAHPVQKYVGYGADGKLYKMEEELQPCIECNKLTTDELQEAGAGDTAPKVCDCWPGVETVKELARLNPAHAISSHD